MKKISLFIFIFALWTVSAIAAENTDCEQSALCFGQKHQARASVFCAKQVERLARYDFKWTDSWDQVKFDWIGWKDKEKKLLIYGGDKIKFQNGFGVWANYMYKCVYDPGLDLVMDIQISPGKLDD
jgi:hypothetical protein